MKNIHPEFAYQSRELGVQIEDTLGEPPDRKNYERVIKSLLSEYANGAEYDDVNLLAFALVEKLKFNDPAGLFAQCANYEEGDAAALIKMVAGTSAEAINALAAVEASNPQLARKAILTAFLFNSRNRWKDDDHSLDALQKDEDSDNDEEDEDQFDTSEEVEGLFDSRGDGDE
ncbi:MAG: hypothetical protein HOO97_04065 [Sideroxydans sp.]|nr:hypothetical protein [Sideroxydans sp.]